MEKVNINNRTKGEYRRSGLDVFADNTMVCCMMIGDKTIEQTEANADYIVKACNNFDALVDVLQNIIDYEDRGRARGEPTISDHWFNPAKQLLNSIKQ